MKLKLQEIKNETSDVKSFIWVPPDDFTWKPGQFLEYYLELEAPDDRGTKRWFTISSAPYEGYVMKTTRLLDKPSSFKKRLFSMKPGDTIEAEGPKGKFIIEDPNQYYIFIAGGIGITPFRSMLAQSLNDKKYLRGSLIYLNKDSDIAFKEELDHYGDKNKDFSIKYLSEKLTIDLLLTSIEPGYTPLFYLSGPEPFVEFYEKLLLEAGFTAEQIKKDYFPGYVWTL